jgi:CheY-like chemotaxis protein
MVNDKIRGSSSTLGILAWELADSFVHYYQSPSEPVALVNVLQMEQEQPLKILMLEDNDDDVEIIVDILQKEKFHFRHKRVETKDEFYQAIHGFVPDIVLCDNGLPGFNSLAALKICLRPQTAIPFVLVAGTLSDELVSCLREGADNYVLKSNLARLPKVILDAIDKKRTVHRALRNEWIETIWRKIVRMLFKPASKFKVNHAVQNISGGPLMVVSGFSYDRKGKLQIICQWYDRAQGANLRQEFTEQELKHFDWNNPDDDGLTSVPTGKL